MSEPSKFSDKEIERQRRAETKRGKNIDEKQVQLKRDIVAIARNGTVEELEEKLVELGIARDGAQWREILRWFRTARGYSLR
jgi:hypothetical protein